MPPFSWPLTVEPASGALNQTSSEPEVGTGVAVTLVVVVLVEVAAAGKTRALPSYTSAMDVRLMENYGQLRVTDGAGGKGLAKVYVKVYARLADGQVKFYKDGYTDHAGRFDYASISTPERQPVSRFAILVLAEERGAVIREAGPPQQ